MPARQWPDGPHRLVRSRAGGPSSALAESRYLQRRLTTRCCPSSYGSERQLCSVAVTQGCVLNDRSRLHSGRGGNSVVSSPATVLKVLQQVDAPQRQDQAPPRRRLHQPAPARASRGCQDQRSGRRHGRRGRASHRRHAPARRRHRVNADGTVRCVLGVKLVRARGRQRIRRLGRCDAARSPLATSSKCVAFDADASSHKVIRLR